MAISEVSSPGVTQRYNSGAGDSLSACYVTHGLSIQAGDVLVLTITGDASTTVSDNNGATPFTLAIGGSNPGSGTYHASMWTRVAGASEPATYNFTFGSSNGSGWKCYLRCFRGVDSSIWDLAPNAGSYGTSGSGTTATAPTRTTLTDGALAILFVSTDGLTTTYSNPTNGFGAELEAVSGLGAMALYTKDIASAGAIGATAVTLNASNDWWIGLQALRPASAGGVTGSGSSGTVHVTERTVSVVIGEGAAAVDLVAEGLVDPASVRDSDCEHGYESASFAVDHPPLILAANPLAAEVPVVIRRNSRVTFEGAAAAVRRGQRPQAVECAGYYDRLNRDQHYAQPFVLSGFGPLVELQPEHYPWPSVATPPFTTELRPSNVIEARVDDGSLHFLIPRGSRIKSGQGCAWYLMAPDTDPVSISAITGTWRCAGAGRLRVVIIGGYGTPWTPPTPFVPDFARASATSSTSASGKFTDNSGSGYLVFVAQATADVAETAQEDSVQLLDFSALFGGLSAAPTPAEAIHHIACPPGGDICLASSGAVGSRVAHFMPSDPGTRGAAIEAARALYPGIVDFGVWEHRTSTVRARPTTPDPREVVCIAAGDLVDPETDYGIEPADEAGLDAVACEFYLVPGNLETPSTDGTNWPPEWTRSTETNCTAYGGGYYRVISDPTELNPWCYSEARPCLPGEFWTVRADIYLGAYTNGVARMGIRWEAADGTLVAEDDAYEQAASDPTEHTVKEMYHAPAGSAWARLFMRWTGRSGAETRSIYARRLSLTRAEPEGTHLRLYYPAAPATAAARVGLLQLEKATPEEARGAARQVYEYEAGKASGSVPLDREHLTDRYGDAVVPTMDGGFVHIDDIHSWMWVCRIDAVDEADRGPWMISRCERSADGVSIEVGGDYWEHPGFSHPDRVGKYQRGRFVTKRVKQKSKAKARPKGKGWRGKSGAWWRWTKKRVWVEGKYV